MLVPVHLIDGCSFEPEFELALTLFSLRQPQSRRVQKYKRTLRPTRRAVAEFIYHYHGELNHQGLGNAFVFLDTTPNTVSLRWLQVR